MIDSIKNAFINKLLERLLDGDKGSNILGAIITAVVGSQINYVRAFQGFQFDNMDNSMESARLVGTLVVAVFAWFVGKKKAGTSRAG